MGEIAVESDGSRMNAIVYVPQGPGPFPVAVLLHGFPGNERNLDLAQVLRRAGFTVLFFHYRGAWGSEGDFRFANALDDLAAAVAHVQSPEFVAEFRADPERIALVGHSMGGFLALISGSEQDAVDCVASLAGANLGLMAQVFAANPDVRKGAVESLDGWGRGPIRGASGAELVAEVEALADSYDTRGRAADLAKKPLLLVGGARDEATPPAQHHDPLVAALKEAGARDVTARVLESDHAFSDRRIALSELVSTWLDESCR